MSNTAIVSSVLSKHNVPYIITYAADLSGIQDVIPETIDVAGIARPTHNSRGQLIHPTLDGIKNFWNWFGSSKIVDEQGRPAVYYHGTSKDVSSFVPNDALGGLIFAAPTAKEAAVFAGNNLGSNVMPVYIKADKPYPKGCLASDEVKTAAKAKRLGYDAIYVHDSAADPYNIGVFSTTQIKSSLGNNGQFSSNATEVTASAPLTSAKLKDLLASLSANEATASHESLEEFTQDSRFTEKEREVVKDIMYHLVLDYVGSPEDLELEFKGDVLAAWKRLVDNQDMGECQSIVSDIVRLFPQCQKFFGEISSDEPYIDEWGKKQRRMAHHWVLLNKKILDFSKGTLADHIDWDNVYSPYVTTYEKQKYHKLELKATASSHKIPSLDDLDEAERAEFDRWSLAGLIRDDAGKPLLLFHGGNEELRDDDWWTPDLRNTREFGYITHCAYLRMLHPATEDDLVDIYNDTFGTDLGWVEIEDETDTTPADFLEQNHIYFDAVRKKHDGFIIFDNSLEFPGPAYRVFDVDTDAWVLGTVS